MQLAATELNIASSENSTSKLLLSIPLPPMSELPQDLQFITGENITWILSDDTKQSGELIDYNASQQMFIVKTDTHKVLILKTNQIKQLTLTTERPYIPIIEEKNNSMSRLKLPSGAQEFTLTYKAGEKLKGETRSFHIDRNGIFLFPAHADNNYTVLFISNELCDSYDIGPKIGEILVTEKIVTEENISTSLAKQKKSRLQPIGEYLCEKAVVTVIELEEALEHQKTMPHLKLGQILVGENLITDIQLQQALQEQKKNRKLPLGEILIQNGLVSTEEIQLSLAKKLGIPFVDLRHFELDEDTLHVIDEKYARKHSVLPLYHSNSKLAVAIEDPSNWRLVEELQFQTGMSIEPVMASIKEIRHSIDTAYTRISLHEAAVSEFGNMSDAYEHKETLASENIIISLVNKIITDAYQKHASDIHIETYSGKQNTRIRIRKDGVLLDHMEAPPQLRKAIIARIKIMASLDVTERRLPQDGKINFRKYSHIKLELRVATLPTNDGLEDAVIRIIPTTKPLPLKRIGLTHEIYQQLNKLIRNPNGLLLVCGPTGSGKTTTLHSILSELNTTERKIWTVEDPVEVIQPGLRQLQVNSKIDLTFTKALRAFLRADPDVIMVGEMRDSETIRTTVEASLTGHMVFSTLHTNSAPESINRLLDMGLDPFNFSDALAGVLAQRLARRLCDVCAETYVASNEEIDELLQQYCTEDSQNNSDDNNHKVLQQWRHNYVNENKEFTLRRSCGCEKCNNTGYNGRIGLYELLICSENIKHQITENVPVSVIKHTAQIEGMQTLKQDGILKVLEGLTDIHQIHSECAR